MINLDDTKQLAQGQGGDSVIRSVAAFGKQIDQAFREVREVVIPDSYKNVEHVVVCGMGGSRFPALIVYHLYKEKLKTSLTVVDDYQMPGFVGANTLVVLSSYSGTTEEVLVCAQKAKVAGAKIVGYCVGAGLAQWLRENKLPVYTFNPLHNPSAQPRIGFGYAIGALLGIFEKLSLLQPSIDLAKDLTAALSELEVLQKKYMPESDIAHNPAKSAALTLQHKYPYFIVAEHLVGVGNAVQNQTNETAKNISSYRVIPELNHHLMEGLRFPKEHTSLAVFVLFQSRLYSERIQKRFTVTEDVIDQNKVATLKISLEGSTLLAQVFEVCAFGSAMTMYLSALYGVDPAKIPYVDYFKQQLK